MLEFNARSYVELAYQLGLIAASFNKTEGDGNIAGDHLSKLIDESDRLGLPVTKAHIGEMVIEIVKGNVGKVTIGPDKKLQFSGNLEGARFGHHVESIQRSLKAELGSILFRAIPRDRARYCDPKWLTDSTMFAKYPDTVDEFQRAGRCYAYGENTACVFHLMRVTDFYLKRVADSLNITYSAQNWGGIGEHITRKMEQKYQNKTADWKHSEPFYAEILTDIQAISRAHRNPALHELDKKYDEREAAYMLTVIEAFADHVASKI